MRDQILPMVLTLIGVSGFWLAANRVWWCWFLNVANQILWVVYALATQQWGFLLGVPIYLFVFVRNAIKATREHRHPEILHKGDTNVMPEIPDLDVHLGWRVRDSTGAIRTMRVVSIRFESATRNIRLSMEDEEQIIRRTTFQHFRGI